MTLQELKIKPLETEQLPQMMELDEICFNGFWSIDGYRREMESSTSNLLIATIPNNEEEQLIGVGCFWSILQEAHITLLAVHPDFQGRGLGKLILISLLEDAIKRKLERATLEVKEVNYTALSLYDQFGFKVMGKRPNYYPKTGESALVLWVNDLLTPEFNEKLKTLRENLLNEKLSFLIES